MLELLGRGHHQVEVCNEQTPPTKVAFCYPQNEFKACIN